MDQVEEDEREFRRNLLREEEDIVIMTTSFLAMKAPTKLTGAIDNGVYIEDNLGMIYNKEELTEIFKDFKSPNSHI